jgi:RimJ/RimL family protein N-acetyltransferase
VRFVESLFDDPYARRFYPNMGTTEQAKRWIAWNLSNYREFGFGLWVIEKRESGVPVGDCGVTMQQVGDRSLPEVGYHLIEPARGCGYAAEAASACVRFAIDVLGLVSVCSIVHPENSASIRVAMAVHAKREAFINETGDEMSLFTTSTDADH